jgi:hypothetical protein
MHMMLIDDANRYRRWFVFLSALSLFFAFSGTLISITNTWLGTNQNTEQALDRDGDGDPDPWVSPITKEQKLILRQLIMVVPLAAGATATFASTQNFANKWGSAVSGPCLACTRPLSRRTPGFSTRMCHRLLPTL